MGVIGLNAEKRQIGAMIVCYAFHWPSQWPFLLNILSLSPETAEASLLELLPSEERGRITSLRRPDDRKRAIVGRLLLRQTYCKLLNMKWKEVVLGRDEAERPYFAWQGLEGQRAPDVDANVSHHGEWIAVVGGKSTDESRIRVGVDLMRVDEVPGGGTAESLLDGMKDLVGVCSHSELS